MDTAASNRFGIRDYFETLIEIMRSPARHFEHTGKETGSRRPLLFLMISGFFYCSVSMTYFFENSLAMGVIMMANAMLMPAFAALVTFILLGMTGRERMAFGKIFNVYAYASGAIMTVSWIPGLAVIMEPVRAVLVGTGLVKALGLGKIRSGMIVILTGVVLLLFFWTTAPLIMELKNSPH